MTDQPETRNVYQAVARAAAACDVAGLDARNEYDKYDYRSIRGVMDAAHMALAEAGVTIALHEMRNFERSEVKTSKGGSEILITYVGVFRVYGPAGDYFDTLHYCEGLDRRDKAGNKASSAGYKEVIQKLLTLPFGHEEAEQDSAANTGAVQGKPRGQRQAIDNKPKPRKLPWDTDPSWVPPYPDLDHVWVRFKRGTDVCEFARPAELSDDDLEYVAGILPRRLELFLEHNLVELHKLAQHDSELVGAEQQARAITTEAPADAEAEPGGAPPATEKPESDQAGATGPDTDKPQDGLQPAAGPEDAPAAPGDGQGNPADLGPLVATTTWVVPTDPGEDEIKALAPAKKLTDDERAMLAKLEQPEVLALACALGNAHLFDSAHASEIAKHNDDGHEPLTPEWLAGPWVTYHDMSKARRRDARMLCREILAGMTTAGYKPSGTQPATKDQQARLMGYLLGCLDTKDLPKAKQMLVDLVERTARHGA